MLRRLDPAPDTLRLTFEDRTIAAREGDSVAAALLAAGIASFRDTPATGLPRSAYCMMGVCFDCLVEIDGIPSRQACLTGATDGMRVRRQRGARNTG